MNLARELARLEEIELNTLHLLGTAYRNLDLFYTTAQTHFNRWQASYEEVQTLTELYKGGLTEIDLVLDAQRRRAQAQNDYYRALCDYNKAVTEVHFRKGSLLEYNSVYLSEGPWPEKACWDALARARERDSSYYLNYGWSRPGVISTGPVAQHQGTLEPSDNEDAEAVPTPAPMPEDVPPNNDPSREPGPVTNRPDGPTLNAPRRAGLYLDSDPVAVESRYDWGDLGLDAGDTAPIGSGVRAASFDD